MLIKFIKKSLYVLLISTFLLNTVFAVQVKKKNDSEVVNKKVITNESDNEEDLSQEKENLMTIEEKENYFRELKIKRAGRFAFGVSLGLIPDVGSLSFTGANIRGISSQLSNFTNQYSITPTGASPTFSTSGEVTSSSRSVFGIPIQMHLAYYSQYFFYKLGFNYIFSTIAVNSSRVQQNDPSLTTGNLSPLDTGVNFLELKSTVSMSYFEIPLTFALRLVNIWGSSFYAGFGPSLFIGGWRRVSQKNSTETINIVGDIPDTDVIFTNTIGFHIVIGGEVFVTQDIAITAEFQYSYGASGKGKDSVITRDANTLRTANSAVIDINSPDIGAYGIETGEDSIPVLFGGFGMQIGVRYIL